MKRFLPWLLLPAALLFIYAPVLLKGADFHPGDLGDCTLPLLNWASRSATGPEVWNPSVLGGRPGIVDGTLYTMLYPPTLAYLVTQWDGFFAVSTVAHALWAAAGMFLLLRFFRRSRPAAFLGALAFAGSGFFAARMLAGQYPHLSSAAWTPWVFRAAAQLARQRRPRDAAWLGALTALQLAAGFPQFVLITLAGLPALWLPRRWRRPSRRELVAAGARFALAAAVFGLCSFTIIQPLAELLPFSQRRAGLPPEDALRDSLAPNRLSSLWLPLSSIRPFDPITMPRLTEFWETAFFIGWSPWLVILLAAAVGLLSRRAVWRWLLLAGAGLALAAGPHLPLYPLLWKLVPGFTMLRSPGRWLLLTVLSLAVLLAFALDRIRARRPRRRRLLAWLPVILMLELAWLAWTLLAPPFPYMMGVPYWSHPNPVSDFLQNQGPTRVVALSDFPLINEALTLGLESCNGYQGVVPGRYYNLVRLGDPRIRTATPLYFFRADNPAFRLFNVRYVITRVALEAIDPRWSAPVFRDGTVRVYELPWPAPRAWLPRSYRPCRDEAEVLQVMAQPEFDPQALAVGVGGDEAYTTDKDTATLERRVGGGLRLFVTTTQPAVLVISEHYLPGWRITVDSVPAEYFAADHALLGVRVPAGRHQVTLDYQPTLTPGRTAGLAAAGLLLVGLLWRLARRLTGAAG